MASMAEKRRALAALAAERGGGRAGRFGRRALATLVLLLLVSLPCLWAAGFFATPRAVAEVRQLVDSQVAEYDRVARGEVPYASAPSASPVWERMRELSPAHREQVGPELGRLWEAHERAEMGSYFALPPEQRQAELDRRLKAEADRRAKWQAEREKREQERAARTGDGGGAAGRGPAAAGAAAPRGGTEESRLQRSKARLDRTTPETRAQQAEYRRALEARRNQLGLPTGGGGRRGG